MVATFLGEAISLVARRPQDFFEIMLASGDLLEASQQSPRLLILAALRQAIKILQSEKMPSGCKAAIAGYVSGTLLSSSGKDLKGLVLLLPLWSNHLQRSSPEYSVLGF